MSSTLSPALKNILEAVEDNYMRTNLTRYACAIGMTILCYDALLTFADEVQLIWGSPWSTTKFLLYFNRILAFFSLLLNIWHLAGFRWDLDSETCAGILEATAYVQILSFCIANWILLLRVSALYGHNRTIFWGLTIFWILSYISTVILMCLTAKDLHGKITYSTLFHVCIIPEMPAVLPMIWVSPIAFEITTFLMSMYKAWSYARENDDISSNPLLRVLYRDGFLYSIVIMGMRVFNLICWLIFPLSLVLVGVFILWALIIVMINRLILNLRNLRNPEKTNQGSEAEGDPWRTHTPAVCSNGAQCTNIFEGGTMVCDEEFNSRSSIGSSETHVTLIEERQSRPLDKPSPNNAGPMPAKAHAPAHHLPPCAPLKQTQIPVTTAATVPLTYKTQGSSPSGPSPQMTALGYNGQPPPQCHGSSSRVLTPRQNCDDWDETWPHEEGDRGERSQFSRRGLDYYGP